MIIYKITNKTNGMTYVGQTARSLNQRMVEHLANGRTSYIDRALRKYGINSFLVDVIDTAETKEELDAKERYYIQLFNSKVPNGYNLTDGGEGQIGVHRYGADNPNYGKHHSEAAKRKMADARKKYSGEHHPRCKPVVNLDTGERFLFIRAACDAYNLDPSTLIKACKGKRKQCGGFRWSYAD